MENYSQERNVELWDELFIYWNQQVVQVSENSNWWIRYFIIRSSSLQLEECSAKQLERYSIKVFVLTERLNLASATKTRIQTIELDCLKDVCKEKGRERAKEKIFMFSLSNEREKRRTASNWIISLQFL